MPTVDVLSALESAVVFELRGRAHLALRGNDRVTFLHNFCTNDIRRLVPGTGCEAFLCNAKGRVLGHVTVFAEHDQLLLDSVPGVAAKLVAHLDRYIIREDVTLHDLSLETGTLYLTGPQAPQRLGTWLHAPPEEFDRLSLCQSWNSATPAGQQPGIRRVDWLGSPGFLISGPIAVVEEWRQELLKHGVVEGTDAGWEALRIAAGWPVYGCDITDEHLPQEVARNERCLSFTKGCYLGQEPIARLDALGHTNRELRRLRGEGPCPTLPADLVAAESGESVGKLTSVATSPAGTGWVGLGYLKTKWTHSGDFVQIRDSSETAQVV